MTTFLIFEKSNKDGILIVNLIKKYFFLVEQKINKEQSQFQHTKVNRKRPKNSHRNIRNFVILTSVKYKLVKKGL